MRRRWWRRDRGNRFRPRSSHHGANFNSGPSDFWHRHNARHSPNNDNHCDTHRHAGHDNACAIHDHHHADDNDHPTTHHPFHNHAAPLHDGPVHRVRLPNPCQK